MSDIDKLLRPKARKVVASYSIDEDVKQKIDDYAKGSGLSASILVNRILRERVGLPPNED